MTVFDFAQALGFGSETQLFEASQAVLQNGDVTWYITRLPDGRWVAWDDSEVSLERVEFFDTRDEAEAFQMAGVEAVIQSELDRVGVSNLGPSDSVVVATAEDGRTVRLYDDAAEWNGSADQALRRLRLLPDGAGWEEFWQTFHD
ncbi:hypothetical protein [Alicyclobacillus macrosporangiidus]|uniref:Uncharacterized protein n=1 Tax=Alicyclobacillus macrosporangiidus TaxID=392015 RepID=A0A1I7KBX5_9BACL|nr:hypothetical protein [Alicyclobacillus macrosporangiidus]SFU94915.1 hypothetical protein SAMN05421543_11513 [Alicyclobacillus macrosporangiidus]